MRIKGLKIEYVWCLLFASCVYFSCSEDEKKDVAPQLNITVVDANSQKVGGANVTLYANEIDWQNKSNAVAETKQTDVNGEVLFPNLEAKIYYIYVSKENANNTYGINALSNALEINTLYKLSINIK